MKVSALAIIMRNCALDSKQGKDYSHLGRRAVVSSRYKQHSAEHLIPQRLPGPKYQKYQYYNKFDNTIVHWYPQFLPTVVLSFLCIILILKVQMLTSGNSLMSTFLSILTDVTISFNVPNCKRVCLC